MADYDKAKFGGGSAVHEASVDALASRVISVLSNRTSFQSAAKADQVHEALRDAILLRSGFSLDATLEQMRNMGVSDTDMVDVFIPDVARDLGNCWDASTLSFAQVSMGAARLQSMIPHLEMSHMTLDVDHAERADTNMMLIVCPDDDHTLGPMIFASQLRRMGYSVRLSLGRGAEELRRAETLRDFEMILFSCSYTRALTTVAKIVGHLKTYGAARPMTVLGGPVLDHVDDVKSITGVDLVTNDMSVALRGLNQNSALEEQDKAAE